MHLVPAPHDLFPEYSSCRLCPRECGADRASGAVGFCGQTDRLVVSSIGPHFGEEPPISGTRGSGTVFLTGCSTGCFFCQNHQISHEGLGRELPFPTFVDQIKALVGRYVHNVNYVTPDHFWPHVRRLIRELKRENVLVPQLINSSGYECEATVREMAEYADIFLPDFKFADDLLAEYCMGRRDYKDVALKAIGIMIEKQGFLDSASDDPELHPATHGVLVRHLVLPGHTDNSVQALTVLREHFGKYLPISLMSQYHPTNRCAGKGLFQRAVSPQEYRLVCDTAQELGFENIFCQTGLPDNEFYPDFKKDEPFKGNSSLRHSAQRLR